MQNFLRARIHNHSLTTVSMRRNQLQVDLFSQCLGDQTLILLLWTICTPTKLEILALDSTVTKMVTSISSPQNSNINRLSLGKGNERDLYQKTIFQRLTSIDLKCSKLTKAFTSSHRPIGSMMKNDSLSSQVLGITRLWLCRLAWRRLCWVGVFSRKKIKETGYLGQRLISLQMWNWTPEDLLIFQVSKSWRRQIQKKNQKVKMEKHLLALRSTHLSTQPMFLVHGK